MLPSQTLSECYQLSRGYVMLYLFTALRVRLDSKLDHANLVALSMLLLLYKVVVASSMMDISFSTGTATLFEPLPPTV